MSKNIEELLRDIKNFKNQNEKIIDLENKLKDLKNKLKDKNIKNRDRIWREIRELREKIHNLKNLFSSQKNPKEVFLKILTQDGRYNKNFIHQFEQILFGKSGWEKNQLIRWYCDHLMDLYKSLVNSYSKLINNTYPKRAWDIATEPKGNPSVRYYIFYEITKYQHLIFDLEEDDNDNPPMNYYLCKISDDLRLKHDDIPKELKNKITV